MTWAAASSETYLINAVTTDVRPDLTPLKGRLEAYPTTIAQAWVLYFVG